jgi:hypothetical protein
MGIYIRYSRIANIGGGVLDLHEDSISAVSSFTYLP